MRGEVCDNCNAELEEGQIGLCEDCCDATKRRQLRARYHARLIEVAKVSFKFALECTERASIEQMKIYLGEK
jgi:hypothetical protein